MECGKYVDHLYGQHEVGGTCWMYLSAVPFDRIGLRTDLGNESAPTLAKAFLSVASPMYIVFPALAIGLYSFAKRRDKISKEEIEAALEEKGGQIMDAYAEVMKPSWIREKLLLGMSWQEYFKSNLTPFNAVMAVILCIGVPVMVYRIVFGLGASTHLSNNNPWGIWIGFDMMAGIAVASGGFSIATAVHLLGMKEYESMVRPALVGGTLGYFFALVGLLFDLGRYYRSTFPFSCLQAPTRFSSWWHYRLFCTFTANSSSGVLPYSSGSTGGSFANGG